MASTCLVAGRSFTAVGTKDVEQSGRDLHLVSANIQAARWLLRRSADSECELDKRYGEVSITKVEKKIQLLHYKLNMAGVIYLLNRQN